MAQDLRHELTERDDELDAYKLMVNSLKEQVHTMQDQLARVKASAAANRPPTTSDTITNTTELACALEQGTEESAVEAIHLASSSEEFLHVVSVLCDGGIDHGNLIYDRAEEIIMCQPSIATYDMEAGMTLLHHTTKAGNFKLVMLLLKHGADPNQPTKGGETALVAACLRGDFKVFDALMRAAEYHGGLVPECGETPLIYAACEALSRRCDELQLTGKVKSGLRSDEIYNIISVLLGAGLDVNKKPEGAQTPLGLCWGLASELGGDGTDVELKGTLEKIEAILVKAGGYVE